MFFKNIFYFFHTFQDGHLQAVCIFHAYKTLHFFAFKQGLLRFAVLQYNILTEKLKQISDFLTSGRLKHLEIKVC